MNRSSRKSISDRIGQPLARRIKARDSHRCIYCGATADSSGAHLHLDHIIPQSKGGADTSDNLVVACRSCNTTRKAMSLAEWSRFVAAAHNLHPTTIARRVRRRLALPLAA